MKRFLIIAGLLASTGGALMGIALAEGQSRAAPRAARPAPPLKIAVVDLQLINREYQKTADVLKKLVSEGEAAQAKAKEMADQGRGLENELKNLERGTPEFEELQHKVQKAASDWKVYRAISDRELKRRMVQERVAVHQEIVEVLKRFADENGYTLVLQINREALAAKSYQIVEQSLEQGVLHHSRTDDITDAVLAYLNQQYEAGAAADESEGAAARAPAARKSKPAKR